MGTTMNLFIVSIVISLALNLVNPGEWGSPLAELITRNEETGQIDIAFLSNKILGVVGIAATAGVFAGLIKSDPQFALIAGIATFLLGFAVLPLNFFTDTNIPFAIRLLVGAPLSIMFLAGLLGWFRGMEL